ncbi:MAG: YggS family pyridoxal phosphate-dependent enzyme [Actinobacteria bacterium]|nr:YggS family pyridoxal phosphate-dependent enzyme [Actinomycetota bacterium]
MSTLADRLGEVSTRIEKAASLANRSAEDVTLIVVTKTHPADLVVELLGLGVTNFGENKDQEASAKAKLVAELASQHNPIWHFVGQLQSNKVKSVLGYAEVLHSLDRQSLLDELNKQLSRVEHKGLQVFIELNLTDDPKRGGIDPNHLLNFAEKVLEVENLQLLGVMGVASLGGSAEADFERIATASQQLQKLAPEARFISAGMSADFEQAIEHGATHIRVGTAITGKRE